MQPLEMLVKLQHRWDWDMFQTQKNAVGVFILLVLNDQGNITPFCLDIKRLQKVEKKCSDTTLDLSRTLASALVLPAKKNRT
jgi:hypothetical protein